jgi:copper(I)-binding protein
VVFLNRIIKLSLITGLFLAGNALADIKVDNAKARATFAMAQTGAAYLTLFNESDAADTLTSVSVPASIASVVELHTVEMQSDMMRMRRMDTGIPLAPKETVTLAPGGYHIMLMGLAGPLNEGDTIPLTLNFEVAPSQTISVPVVKM